MADNLVSRLKEKPVRHVIQGLLAATFLGETLEAGVKWAERVNQYEPQIRDVVGSIGYWTAQTGIPVAEAGLTAVLGYIAVKGAGMFLDKNWYNTQ